MIYWELFVNSLFPYTELNLAERPTLASEFVLQRIFFSPLLFSDCYSEIYKELYDPGQNPLASATKKNITSGLILMFLDKWKNETDSLK